MADNTGRFALPFLVPGQAQKEAFHNEALAIIDSCLHAAAEGPPLAVPPVAPALGQSWIVAGGGEGAWAGKANMLATWTDGGWRHAAPVAGMLVWNKADGQWLHWTGTAWSGGELPAAAIHIGGRQVVGPRLAAIADPGGGTVIDLEARAAIAAIIAAFRQHGLTD